MSDEIENTKEINEEDLTPDRHELKSWDRRTGEPKLWFLRFQRYYLYRGLARSLRRAFAAFLRENFPEDDKWQEMYSMLTGFGTWRAMATQWEWEARANAWDEERNEEILGTVEQARMFLKEHAIDAAEALLVALSSPRLTVAAANAILDRAGIPAVQKLENLNANVPVTADDLSSAQEEIERWKAEQQTRQSKPSSDNG